LRSYFNQTTGGCFFLQVICGIYSITFLLIFFDFIYATVVINLYKYFHFFLFLYTTLIISSPDIIPTFSVISNSFSPCELKYKVLFSSLTKNAPLFVFTFVFPFKSFVY